MIKKLCLLFTIILLALNLPAQQYSQNDFIAPLDIPMFLSGTFGELRSNHLHSGIDIKTNGKQGLPVYAVADGYVSRIKVSPYGYGNAIYVTHPNGFTSVYGHLKSFSKEIATYIHQLQYNQKSFALDIYPNKDKFIVSQKEVIGYSGNTGGSAGPHLHFEIRETESEKPVNPLLFGFDIRDEIPPTIVQLAVYSFNGHTRDLEKTVWNIDNKDNRAKLKSNSDTLLLNTRMTGFGIIAFDRLNGANNKNGLYDVQLFLDNEQAYHFRFEKFAFDESRYVNALIDFCHYKSKKQRIQQLFKLPGNLFSIIRSDKTGFIHLTDEKPHQIEIRVADAYGNQKTLQFFIKSMKKESVETETIGQIMPHDRQNKFSKTGIKLTIPSFGIYDTIDFQYHNRPSNNSSIFSLIHQVHQPCTPVHFAYDLAIKSQGLPENLIDKALVVNKNQNGKIYSMGGLYDTGWVICSPRSFGVFYITIDTTRPSIKLLSKSYQGQIRTTGRVRFAIRDNLSGIKSYDAYIDGQWVLAEFDGKTATLKVEIPKSITLGEHSLKLIVKDKKNNQNIFQSKIYKL
jgi:peptidase M23-like protein